MKTLFKLYLRRGAISSVEAFDVLASMFPEWHNAAYSEFDCRVSFDDPRVSRILESVKPFGLHPPHGMEPNSANVLSIQVDRTYERRDFESAPAVQLNPISRYHKMPPKNDNDRLIVPMAEIKPKSRIMTGGYDQLLISAETKSRFDAEKFQGMVFRPLELEGPARSVTKYENMFWELNSTIVLPPMSPRMRYFHAISGDEVTGEASPPFVYRNGLDFPDNLISPPELHFTNQAWSSIPPFDIARTFEKPMGYYGVPIVSQRLYRFLAAMKIASDWVPVRVLE
jgi:hypothetical protein